MDLLEILGISATVTTAITATVIFFGRKYFDNLFQKNLSKFNIKFSTYHSLKINSLQKIYSNFSNFKLCSESLLLDNDGGYKNLLLFSNIYEDVYGERREIWCKAHRQLSKYYSLNRILFSKNLQSEFDSFLNDSQEAENLVNESYNIFIDTHPSSEIEDWVTFEKEIHGEIEGLKDNEFVKGMTNRFDSIKEKIENEFKELTENE